MAGTCTNRVQGRSTEGAAALELRGEARIHAELIDGPVENLSILLGRDRYWTSVRWVDERADVPAADTVFILCMAGAVQVSGHGMASIGLRAQQAVLWRNGAIGLRIEAMPSGGRALAVGLERRDGRE